MFGDGDLVFSLFVHFQPTICNVFHLGCVHCYRSGADPGFQKGGGAVASGARSQDFFGQFRVLFKEFGAKRGGRAPPALPLWIRACRPM